MVRVNKKPYIITIIVLIIVILVLGGYIVYNNFIKADDEVKVVTMVDDVNINLNAFYQISETLSKFDIAYNKTGSNYFGYIYKQKKLDVKKIDQKAALYAAMIKDLIPSNINQTILAGKVKESYEEMFDNSLKYNPESIDITDGIKVNYDSNSGTFSYTIPTSTNNYAYEYITSNVKTILEDDKVIITRKIFYVEYNGNGLNASKAIIYTDSNKQKKLGEVSLKSGKLSTKEVMGKYGAKLNTYDYTFIKNSDDDYTFSMIERIK